MLSEAASDMTFISEHNYWQGKEDVVAHVAQVPAAIRKVADVRFRSPCRRRRARSTSRRPSRRASGAR
jgi:hypothetical protein